MMIVNFVGIRIRKNGKEPMDFCMALDNEERAELVAKADLLDGVTSARILLERLPVAFQDPYAQDYEEDDPPRDMIQDFDYENAFPRFCRKVEKLPMIDEVLLYTTSDKGNSMDVSFARYDLAAGKFLTGRESIETTENNEWREEFLARIEEKADGEKHVYDIRFDPVKKKIPKNKSNGPLIIENKVVVGICNGESPEKIVVPEGVTEIGSCAFANLESLQQVELPSSIRIIGERAFSECENLKEIMLPEGLQIIQIEAFENAGLSKLSLPNSLVHIADLAFTGCDYITWLRLSRGIKDYRHCAWYLEASEDEPLTVVLPKDCTPEEFVIAEDEDFWNQEGLIVKVEEK